MNTGRLTNVSLYNRHLHLCVENIRAATAHGNEAVKDKWVWHFIKCIHFMDCQGYKLVGNDPMKMYFR